MNIPDAPSSRDDLAAWTDCLYAHFDCVNANARYGWDPAEAHTRLSYRITSQREVVVLLGRRVQNAYANITKPAASTIEALDFYEWGRDVLSPTGRREVLVLPAPRVIAGLVKEPASRAIVGRLLNEAVAKASELHETRL
jgi:hypothetical protein